MGKFELVNRLHLYDDKGTVFSGSAQIEEGKVARIETGVRTDLPSGLVAATLVMYASELMEPALKVKALVLLELLLADYENENDDDTPF